METKTETKEELIQRLLLEHEEKQEEERLKQEAEKDLKKRKRDQYIKMFDTLGVPHEDVIVIRNLDFKNTIVHACDRVFDFKHLGNWSSDYYRKEDDFCYIEKSSRSLEERVLYSGKPKYYIVDINIMNKSKVSYIRGDRKVHIFYEDSATLCPFCGDLDCNENKNAVGYIFSDTYLTNLRTQAVFYKRCRSHNKMSRKDYLNSHEKGLRESQWGKKEKSYLEDLRESIYPTPIKHDREHFKNKTHTKEERKRKKTYPHFKGIKGLYKKRGFYYWQAPQKDGIRPKAIALQTKDYNEALKKLDEIEEGFELTEYTEVGNVYLMKSDRNGRVKIGRTKDKPVYRERTLQSQEPEVRLIFHREVLYMNETEKYLHRFFKRKRFRGEWFDLSEDDIEKAKSIIKKGVGGSLFSKVAHE